MKRAQGKAASSRAFGAGGGGGGGGGFGGFSKASDAGSSLSYLVEPPSFTAISDPNAVVSFKNTLKKDSVTKGKGLEELLVHVQAHPYEQDGGVEEAILDAWVCGGKIQLLVEQLLIVCLGENLPSNCNRQLATGSRAVPHLAIRAHEVCP